MEDVVEAVDHEQFEGDGEAREEPRAGVGGRTRAGQADLAEVGAGGKYFVNAWKNKWMSAANLKKTEILLKWKCFSWSLYLYHVALKITLHRIVPDHG